MWCMHVVLKIKTRKPTQKFHENPNNFENSQKIFKNTKPRVLNNEMHEKEG